MLRYALALLPFLVASCSQSGATVVSKPHVDPGRYVKTVKSGEIERKYILRVPKSYDNKTALPLVVLLHGWTGSGAQVELNTGFGAKADKEGFILLAPDGTAGLGQAKGWNTGFLNLGASNADDVKFVTELIDQAEKDMYVDPARIYIAGHSNGAMMTYTLGAKLAKKIAAIAPVAGSIGVGTTTIAPPSSPVSAIIFHGKADPMVAYDETSKDALLQSIAAPKSAKFWAEKVGAVTLTETTAEAGNVILQNWNGKDADVQLVTIVNGGHMWPQSVNGQSATDMIWEFFKTHPRKG